MGGCKPKFCYWKLNNTLLKDEQFLNNVKLVIKDCWNKAKNLNIYGGQWEYMKYDIRKIAIQRSKEIAKKKREKKTILLKKLLQYMVREIYVIRIKII